MDRIDNLHIKQLQPLIPPNLLLAEIPRGKKATQTVNTARKIARNIIAGKDPRLLVIVGPCSIHDPVAALEYAQCLKKCADLYAQHLHIIMRVYFEKPRTRVGWKGLINDPLCDGSFQINKGLHTARKLLHDINGLGLATGSEFLDTIIPQYIADLTAWGAIGARTTESQIHRELASGLSMPVGFKNGTHGNIQIALDAVCATQNAHNFLGVTKDGIAAIVATRGNPDCHIILRGSSTGPNYDDKTIATTLTMLKNNHLKPRVMIDCSHGNSNKDHTQQAKVVESLAKRIAIGKQDVCGLMIESNLIAGNQPLKPGRTLVYGQSITDACAGWEETEMLLATLSEAVTQRSILMETSSHENY